MIRIDGGTFPLLHLEYLAYIATLEMGTKGRRSAPTESRREIRTGDELTAETDLRHVSLEMSGRLQTERCLG